jgi:ATP synthase subunit 6
MSSLVKNINFGAVVSSPLDQFGLDTGSWDILNNGLFDLIPFIDVIPNIISFLGLSEFDSFIDYSSVVAAIVGVILFDDEGSTDPSWEDASNIISSLQSTIFMLNIVGMIPGTETITSEASFALALSITLILTITLVGFSIHKINYFAVLYPTGTPAVMAPFIISIELISYVARAVSLGMRLFANMFAGHTLVKIMMSLSWSFITSSAGFLSLPVVLLLVIIFLLECGIAYLQSYVFATLCNMYIQDAITIGGH